MARKVEAASRDAREELLAQIARLADVAISGSASQTYRTCGNKQCRCHGAGPKHGPHMYVSYRGPAGKTTGYYVPQAAHEPILTGIEAWRELQDKLRELSALNKERAFKLAKEEARK